LTWGPASATRLLAHGLVGQHFLSQNSSLALPCVRGVTGLPIALMDHQYLNYDVPGKPVVTTTANVRLASMRTLYNEVLMRFAAVATGNDWSYLTAWFAEHCTHMIEACCWSRGLSTDNTQFGERPRTASECLLSDLTLRGLCADFVRVRYLKRIQCAQDNYVLRGVQQPPLRQTNSRPSINAVSCVVIFDRFDNLVSPAAYRPFMELITMTPHAFLEPARPESVASTHPPEDRRAWHIDDNNEQKIEQEWLDTFSQRAFKDRFSPQSVNAVMPPWRCDKHKPVNGYTWIRAFTGINLTTYQQYCSLMHATIVDFARFGMNAAASPKFLHPRAVDSSPLQTTIGGENAPWVAELNASKWSMRGGERVFGKVMSDMVEHELCPFGTLQYDVQSMCVATTTAISLKMDEIYGLADPETHSLFTSPLGHKQGLLTSEAYGLTADQKNPTLSFFIGYEVAMKSWIYDDINRQNQECMRKTATFDPIFNPIIPRIHYPAYPRPENATRSHLSFACITSEFVSGGSARDLMMTSQWLALHKNLQYLWKDKPQISQNALQAAAPQLYAWVSHMSISERHEMWSVYMVQLVLMMMSVERKIPGFRHNDLHAENIRVAITPTGLRAPTGKAGERPVENAVDHWVTPNCGVRVPCTGVDVRVIDFDLSTSTDLHPPDIFCIKLDWLASVAVGTDRWYDDLQKHLSTLTGITLSNVFGKFHNGVRKCRSATKLALLQKAIGTNALAFIERVVSWSAGDVPPSTFNEGRTTGVAAAPVSALHCLLSDPLMAPYRFVSSMSRDSSPLLFEKPATKSTWERHLRADEGYTAALEQDIPREDVINYVASLVRENRIAGGTGQSNTNTAPRTTSALSDVLDPALQKIRDGRISTDPKFAFPRETHPLVVTRKTPEHGNTHAMDSAAVVLLRMPGAPEDELKLHTREFNDTTFLVSPSSMENGHPLRVSSQSGLANRVAHGATIADIYSENDTQSSANNQQDTLLHSRIRTNAKKAAKNMTANPKYRPPVVCLPLPVFVYRAYDNDYIEPQFALDFARLVRTGTVNEIVVKQFATN
jgi:hypothetical protein